MHIASCDNKNQVWFLFDKTLRHYGPYKLLNELTTLQDFVTTRFYGPYKKGLK